jgi:hypothetical protein
MICQQCKCEFFARRVRVFCGRKCKDDSARTKIDLAKLTELAVSGSKSTYMAAVFSVSVPTVTRALQTHGLYGLWQELRNA